MSASRSRTERTTIGDAGPAAEAADHLDAVDAGEAEVEDDEVRVLAGGEVERRLAGRGEVDVVAACAKVRVQRTEDLRLVVDDQDPGHRAAFSRTTTVSPPPGVSSTSIEPFIASTKPLRDGQAEPDAFAAARVAQTLERDEHAVALVGRDAWAAIDDADVDAAVDCAGHDARRVAGGRVGGRVRDDVGQRSLEQAGVGDAPAARPPGRRA